MSGAMADVMRIHPEVAEALDAGRPVVALESTIIAHGLPRPRNLRTAALAENAVRDNGATPATIALVGGAVHVGLDAAALAQVAGRDHVVKVGVRDLAPAITGRVVGATTVAATAAIAHRAGIRVFATGGLGGVHRDAATTYDESADLPTLAQTPITVVCAGIKSILDVPATLERLETMSIGVVGYRTDRFPGFYLTDSSEPLSWRADTPAEIAEIMRVQRQLGGSAALIVANPVPAAEQLDPALHNRVLHDGLAEARARGVRGKEVTPFLLAYFHDHTGGGSLDVNVSLIQRNAALAAEIAAAAARVAE